MFNVCLFYYFLHRENVLMCENSFSFISFFSAALSVGGVESSLQDGADLHLLAGHSNGVFSFLL